MNAAARNRFVLPRTAPTAPRGRLVMPEPREAPPAAQRANPPQAYVPYASPTPRSYAERPAYAAPDKSMQTVAIVGLILTTVAGIPVGIVTGPMALKRAKIVEEQMRNGRRPRTDESTITGTRVAAWLSIAWAVPLALGYLLAFLLLVAIAL